MTMTRGSGPFGEAPAGVFNAEVPQRRGHVLYFEDCPRRVRVELAGVTIADSRRVKLMHETGLSPVYYFPEGDVLGEVLRPSETRTRCPFKGEARHYSIALADRVADDAAWTYPDPIEGAPPLAGYLAFYWDRVDRWLEEDDEVFVHPRDPYHRIDVLPSARRVRVRVRGALIAETSAPRILFECGLPPRYYIDPVDVETDWLTASDTHTRCPYKGLASYRSADIEGATVRDVAWLYPEPLRDAQDVQGWLCFDEGADEVEIELD